MSPEKPRRYWLSDQHPSSNRKDDWRYYCKSGVEIFLEEDWRGGIIDGPRFYFRDPDGTPLEFINRTHYARVGVRA